MTTENHEIEQEHTSQRVYIPVLIYHSISDVKNDYHSVSPQLFADHMKWIASERHPLSLAEAKVALESGHVPEKSVLITFDDGYRDLIENALPVLLQHVIPALFFLLVEAMGLSDYWNPRAYSIKQHLTSEDVRELTSIPGMAIGAHGFTHQRVTRFEEYRIAAEMAGAKAGLETLTGQEVDAYAYPFGGVTETAARVASRYFSLAFATDDSGVWNWRENPFAIRRISVSPLHSLTGLRRLLDQEKFDDRIARRLSILRR